MKQNFNLPKRAPTPLGYSGNSQSWEVERNNSANVKFQDDDFTTQAYDATTASYYPAWYDDFEARFPDDTWRDYAMIKELATFIKSTWREQATNATLSPSVTYRVNGTSSIDAYGSDSSYTVVDEVENGSSTGYKIITFTKDTPAYRLTKFKAEAPNYIEMQSAYFYYLFTEFFLMIDSRAKNMFIGFHGSDCTVPNTNIDRKAVFEIYDADTAIGTNNSGVLMFGFYLEDTDTVSNIISGGEGGGSNAPVFNAQDSVLWCNIRDAFKSEIAAMYVSLRTGNNTSWTYNYVKTMYEDHQAKWSEAIFNEDAYTKYLVPLIEEVTWDEENEQWIKTDRYLTMLQGSKEEQRKWWLYNRFRYFDSKYITGDAANRTITMRLFNAGRLSIKTAIDMYAAVRFGGGTTALMERTTAGNAVNFDYVPSTGVTEMETWIYSADMITDVGDLSVFYPNELDFSRATKLRVLKIGSNANGYSNANLTTVNVQNAVLLESIDCRNCPNLAITVNMENSPRLQEAYFGGTAITGVELADGAAIETLQLPSTITTLTLMNLNNLQNLSIASYSNISRLMLANIDTSVLNPVTVLNNIQANSQVNIQGLHLELANASAIEDFLDLLDNFRGVSREKNANGQWIYHDYDTAQVSGTIHTASLTGNQIASYNARYPYITIIADHTTSNLYYYTYDGSTLLYTETINDGGDGGAYTGQPSRPSTPAAEFIFIGWSRSMNATAIDTNALKNVVADRNVYAAYQVIGATYRVRFYNGTTLLQTVTDVPYDSTAYYTGSTPVHPESPSDFAFRGWSPSNEHIVANTDCYAQYTDLRSDLIKYLAGTLESYVSTDNTDKIGGYAFYYLDSLQNSIVPVASIEGYGFSRAANLESIELTNTNSVEIGNLSFMNDNKLKALIVRSQSVSTLSSFSAFNGTPIGAGIGGIYVPSNLLASYKSASNWSTFADNIYPIDSYPVTDFSTISDSWTQIIASIDNNTYTTKYNIGDTKRININGYDFYAQIVAFDTDVLSDGTTTVPITFITKNFAWTNRMYSTSTTNGGWADCLIRAQLNDDILPTIDSSIASRIKEVKKTYYDYGTSSTLYTLDKLWIPSLREVNNSSTKPHEDSGAVYNEVFSGDGGLIKYNVESGFLNTWWLRSAYNATQFIYISSNSDYYGANANGGQGVVIGFCLGRAT